MGRRSRRRRKSGRRGETEKRETGEEG